MDWNDSMRLNSVLRLHRSSQRQESVCRPAGRSGNGVSGTGSLAGRGGQQTVRDRSIGKEGSRQTVRNRFVGRRERPTNCGKPGGSRLGLDEGSSGELSGVETLGMTIGIVDKDWDLD